ncbi:MAG: hypothetical protein EXS13_00165 [Planctomycetes bacterium]|nr:hypothetical protein [Planctomycetota bacterium]
MSIGEAEALFVDEGSGPISERMAASYVASGGAALALPAGEASVTFEWPDGAIDAGSTLWWRAAAVALPVEWRFMWLGEVVHFAQPARAHGECLDWFELGVPPVGARVLRATKPAGSGACRIDQIAIANGGARPEMAPSVWRSADTLLEVRAAEGARVADPEWTLKLLAEARAAVEARLGVRVTSPVVLVALRGAACEFEESGGFQNGCAIFLRDDELHLPWRGYAHEWTHVIEEARGWSLPWSWSEGLACALALDVALGDFAGLSGPGEEEQRLLRLLHEGDSWWHAGRSGGNELLPWSEEPAASDAIRRSAYSWAALLVHVAAGRSDQAFWSRLAAVLDRSETASPVSTDAFLAALTAAALEPLDDLFTATGVRRAAPRDSER